MDMYVPEGFRGDDIDPDELDRRWEEAQSALRSNDPVLRPSYYKVGKYEVLDVIMDWEMDFVLGNVIKYVARAGRKGAKSEDLKKARVYLERAILEAEVEEAKLA